MTSVVSYKKRKEMLIAKGRFNRLASPQPLDLTGADKKHLSLYAVLSLEIEMGLIYRMHCRVFLDALVPAGAVFECFRPYLVQPVGVPWELNLESIADEFGVWAPVPDLTPLIEGAPVDPLVVQAVVAAEGYLRDMSHRVIHCLYK